MKWVTRALIAVGVLMTIGLGLQIGKQAQLQERRMIKWSEIERPQQAGSKVARFLFPLLQEKKQMQVTGQGKFTESFFSALQEEVGKNNSNVKIRFGGEKSAPFFLKIQDLPTAADLKNCESGNLEECSALDAIRKFNKLEFKGEQLWITMYRLAEDESVLYFKRTTY